MSQEEIISFEKIIQNNRENELSTTITQNFCQRLSAGASDKTQVPDEDDKEDDDLPKVDYEGEEEPTTKKTIHKEAAKEDIKPDDSVKYTKSHWVKVAILVIIWCIYAVNIMSYKDDINYPVLLSLPPKIVTRHRLFTTYTESVISLQIRGPFQLAQDLKKLPPKREPQLQLSVILDLDNNIKYLSNISSLVINKPNEMEKARLVTKNIRLDLKEDVSKYERAGEFHLKMETNIENDLTVKISFEMTPINPIMGIILGAMVLIFLYVLIIWEFINQTLAAILASILAISILGALNCKPTTATIMKWLDVETLMLLFGMMILVSILSESGIFDYLAVVAYQLAKGKMLYLIYLLCFFVAFLSAFLDNVTMMLLLTPVTIRLCEVTNLNPVPVLMSMVIYSNVGAALTPVGDPPNVIIMTNPYVQDNGVNFGNFIGHMLPGVLLGLTSTFIYLFIKYPTVLKYMSKESIEIVNLKHEILVWEKAANKIQPTTIDEEIVQSTLLKKAQALRQEVSELEAKGINVVVEYKATLAEMKDTYPIRKKELLIKSIIAFVFVLVLFFLHIVPHLQHLSLGWSALVGALLLLVLADSEDLEAVLARVEWSTLLFFACLFVLMEALTELGLIGTLGDLCVMLILKASPDYRLLVAILIILWISGIASAFLNNIPVTTMMIKIVINLSQNQELEIPLTPLIWALAFGACFGGNGSLIGASANVVASGVSEQHGYRFSFVGFFLFGFPIMILSLSVVTIYLYLSHCFWAWH